MKKHPLRVQQCVEPSAVLLGASFVTLTAVSSGSSLKQAHGRAKTRKPQPPTQNLLLGHGIFQRFTFYSDLSEALKSSPEGRALTCAKSQISTPCFISCRAILKHISTIIL